MADSRLRVDPSVGVSDLQGVLKGLFKSEGSRDLAKYLSHPTHYAVTWKTAPDKDIMAKTASLMSGFANLAPNTQVSSAKLIKALDAENKYEKMDFTKKDAVNFSTWCDLRIRVLLSQYRKCKQSQEAGVNRILKLWRASREQ